MLINEVAEKWKAGGIPFFVNKEGVLRVLLVTSTDPRMNGPDPAIAKGYPNKGENSPQAAMREMSEETGVKKSDIADIHFLGIFPGKFYALHTYAFQLKREVPPVPDVEAVGHWYDADAALGIMHKGHRPALQTLINSFSK